LSNLAFAGLLVIAVRVIKEWFHSVNRYSVAFSRFELVFFHRKTEPKPIDQLNETIQSLQQSLVTVQRNILRLEQTASRLASTPDGTSAADTIQQELRLLKGSVLAQSASSSLLRATSAGNTDALTTQDDRDGIIVLHEHETKLDADD
jgi:hypothetical protein